MKSITNKRRAGSPYDTSSSKAANYSTTNDSDDAKAVEFSDLYHPYLTHLVSKNPIHAESWGKGEHHRSERRLLRKADKGPLAEETSREANGHGRFHFTQSPELPTPTPTSEKPSNHASRGSYDQDAKAQPPMHPLQEHDKNHMVEKKCDINTNPHNPSAQHTPKTSASEPTTSQAKNAIYIQSLSPHQPSNPSVDDFRKPLQYHQSSTTPSHIRFQTPSAPPPPPDYKEYPWDPKIPSTHSNINLYSPPAVDQEELHARLANRVPAYDASYPQGYTHLSWRGPESFESNRLCNNLSAAVDLNELDVAPWCGTDLVGDPTMFLTHVAQARADDARHKRVKKWSLEEQRMRTQWHPQRYLRRPTRGQGTGGSAGENAERRGGRQGRLQPQVQSQSQSQGQGGYADYGLLDQNDEVRAAAKWASEIESSGDEGKGPILVPIRDTSARLVDMVVSSEQAEQEALFLPPVSKKYASKAEEKREGNVFMFLISTILDELRFSGEKVKGKKK